jgi:hypothetical protein
MIAQLTSDMDDTKVLTSTENFSESSKLENQQAKTPFEKIG